MIRERRERFNATWTAGGYARLLGRMQERCGMAVSFRIAETPCFFRRGFVEGLAAEAAELLAQLESPEYRLASQRALPPEYNVPGEPDGPLFAQVDFGLVRNEAGEVEPRLVEIQGFPSLYAFQPALAEAYQEAFDLKGFEPLVGEEEYWALLKRHIVGEHDPREVVLLEVYPDEQKTQPDFVLTERTLGIRTVCITEVRKQGNRLYQPDGTPIRRIYNRAIVDELERRGVGIPFRWADPLEVEWAGHPNFYFRISKFALPHLRHRTVAPAYFLDQVGELPADLDRWVLKPLFSFAGLGVTIGPTREQIRAIRDPENWILQQRMEFAPVIETPHGPTKVEIRVMFVAGRAVTLILRMGRGKMMGVDFNKDMEWVGASAALIELAS